MLKTKAISECKRELNFSPTTPWPSPLPAICWNDWLITGFDRPEDEAVVDNGDSDLTATWMACHPKMSLSELSRLWSQASQTSLEFNWTQLFSHYGLRDSENLRTTLVFLAKAPVEFQNWVTQKSVLTRDLAILRSFQVTTSDLPTLLKALGELNPSKSQGVRQLELAGELLLMGEPLAELLPTADATKWLSTLEKMRYQQTSVRDEDEKQLLTQLPWPKATQVQWKRWGDRSGLEIRFTVESMRQLKDKAEGLLHAHSTYHKQDQSNAKSL